MIVVDRITVRYRLFLVTIYNRIFISILNYSYYKLLPSLYITDVYLFYFACK